MMKKNPHDIPIYCRLIPIIDPFPAARSGHPEAFGDCVHLGLCSTIVGRWTVSGHPAMPFKHLEMSMEWGEFC